MTIKKQHETLLDMYYDVESLRNTLSHMRFRNEHIDDIHMSDIACSIEEVARDLVEAMNANQNAGKVFENIPDLSNHINA
jgi:hypothetical protein